MIRKSAMICALALVAVAATGVSAQKIEGTYEFQQKVRTSMESEPIDVVAKLTVTLKGDTAIGSWVVAFPGREPKPVELKGTVKGNTLTLLTGTQQAKLSGGSGEERTIDVTSTYVLTISGDEISGEITSSSSDENVQLPSRPLKGKRAA